MSPSTRDADRDDDLLPKVLGVDRKYRSIVATINYMATDTPDLQFACKEVCREMSAPTVQSWKTVKRIGRYLLGREKVVWMFPWKDGHGSLKVFTDSDWAGDLETRKSTSEGIITIGEHCLKTWSTNQSSPALSSCEAENYAVVDGASRALGMQTAAKELGIEVGDLSVEIATDSSGAKSLRVSAWIRPHPSYRGEMAVAAAGCGGWEVPHDQGSRRQESSGHSDEVQGFA